MGSKYEEMLKRHAERQGAKKEERRKRDDDEAEEVEAALIEDEANILILVPEAHADLVGSVVMRLPSDTEVSHYRHVMWRDSAEKGVVETKSKASIRLASACRVWPDADRYAALIKRHPLVADRCAKELLAASEAAADSEAKS